MRRIQTMSFRGLSSMPFQGMLPMPFRGMLPMPFRGKQCLSPPHTSLCLPQCNQMITMFHNYNKNLSTHGRVYSTQWQAQLTPSPQGFSSLPRVSEAFTPNTTINPQHNNSRHKTKCNGLNMFTHKTTITTYAKCNHIDSFKHTLTYTFPTFTR